MHEWHFNPCAPLERQTILARFALAGVNDVKRIVESAAKILGEEDGTFEGYQQHDRARIRKQVKGLYDAARRLNLGYRNDPLGSVPSKQKVRSARVVLRDGHGCCLDLVLLLAAAVHSAGLFPLIVVVGNSNEPTHAVLAYWRDAENDGLGPDPLTGTVLDEQRIQHLITGKHLGLLDANSITADKSQDFESAEAAVLTSLSPGPQNICYAVDVQACLLLGIEPIPSENRFLLRWFLAVLVFVAGITIGALLWVFGSRWLSPMEAAENLIQGPVWATKSVSIEEPTPGSYLFMASTPGGEAWNSRTYLVDSRTELRLNYSSLKGGIMLIQLVDPFLADDHRVLTNIQFSVEAYDNKISLSDLFNRSPRLHEGKLKIGVKLLFVGGCSVRFERLELRLSK